MTKEEAKTFLCSIAGDLGFTDIENYTCKDGEKMREAIKALEQEPKTDTLNRIRAEILVLDDADHDFEGYYKAVTDALKIIDKYKAESEVG